MEFHLHVYPCTHCHLHGKHAAVACMAVGTAPHSTSGSMHTMMGVPVAPVSFQQRVCRRFPGRMACEQAQGQTTNCSLASLQQHTGFTLHLWLWLSSIPEAASLLEGQRDAYSNSWSINRQEESDQQLSLLWLIKPGQTDQSAWTGSSWAAAKWSAAANHAAQAQPGRCFWLV